MNSDKEKKEVTMDLLRKYGARWAVLTAFKLDLQKRGFSIPEDTISKLEMAQIQIGSGCFSACEVGDSLVSVEAALLPKAADVGDSYVNKWLDLLAEAMSGSMDLKRISSVPLLKPVERDCVFLKCGCGW